MIHFRVKKSPFSDLYYFKLCENYTVDVMHDFLEGMGQTVLNLFLKFRISSSLITLDDLNKRIRAFDYGLYNRGNFPSDICLDRKYSIGQRAAHTHCLIVFLPLILQDITPKLDKDYGK